MRHLGIILTFFILMTGLAKAEELQYRIVVDWTDPSTLDEVQVHQCDDSFVTHFVLVVPREGEDSNFYQPRLSADNVGITDTGEAYVGCEISVNQTSEEIAYTIDARSEGGCELRLHRQSKSRELNSQEGNYYFGDSC